MLRQQIGRAIQIDLEGDGSEEVVVIATRLSLQNQSSTDAAAGYYSFVAVQKTVNSRPMLVELRDNYFP
jgi:hypothetical protein